MTDTKRNPGDLQATVDKLGLKLSAVFIPFSQSRNAKEKQPSLNWQVTLYTLSPIDGQRHDIVTTDYSAGCGHCPSYKASIKALGNLNSVIRQEAIAFECEYGRTARFTTGLYMGGGMSSGNRLEPETLDVIHSLVMDSDVLDSGGFESWASDLGYDTDSRKAEATYRACLDIALKLRAAIGDKGLSELRQAFEGY